MSHVLQNVQVTGRHYAYARKKDRNAKGGQVQSDSEIHSGDEALLKQDDRDSKHPSAGLFHKDGVAERMYDLQESVRQEMQRMDGEVGESEIAKFFKTLKEMKRNKHFHEYQLFHDEAIKNGLSKLDKKVGRTDYFAKQIFDFLSNENHYRKLNQDGLEQMKEKS